VLGYDRLTLRLDPLQQGTYDVYAEGSAGEAHGRFKLPFHARDMENFVLRMSRGRRAVRRMETPETSRAQDFGRDLFEALFQGDVRDVYRTSLAEARRADRGLRITLQLTQVPELMDVPWEFLYDEPSFLSISAWTPVVRYLDLSRPRAPLSVRPPLRILGMVSSPDDCVPLNCEEERARLQKALDPLIADGRVELQWTEDASLSALLRTLQRNTFHVFHYIGHGAYDQTADDGVLLLEGPQGGEPVSGGRLGTILCEHRSLRLAVLNACEGARTSETDPYAGVASSLVQRELPAVIAMQFEITDEAAIVFSEFFYDALALGQPVDNALAYARQGVYAGGNDVEWATPVLLMRVADGRLFEVDWERARAAEPRLSLQLESDPPAPVVGEPVTWRLAVANVGEPGLSGVRAQAPGGRLLAPAIELASGEQSVITWTEPARAEPEHVVTVEAVADHGGHLREEVVARVAVLEPEPLALTLECTPSSARAGEDVLWRLTVGNRGSVPLVGVTAVGPEGRQLDRSADLAPGERRVLSWSAPATADGAYTVTVGAGAASGRPIVREMRGRVEIFAGNGSAAPPSARTRREPATEQLDSGHRLPPGHTVAVAPSVAVLPSFSLAQVRPFLDHVLAGAGAGLIACAATLWMWSNGVGERISGHAIAGVKLGDVRKVVFVALFAAVFTAIYAGCLAVASRSRSPIRAGFAGLGLGAVGGLAGGLLRFVPTSDSLGLVLCLAAIGLTVGVAGAFGAAPAQRAWCLVAGLGGGLLAGWLLVDAWNPPGFDSLVVDVVLGLVIACAVGAAAHLSGRLTRKA